jgi:plastocyanin
VAPTELVETSVVLNQTAVTPATPAATEEPTTAPTAVATEAATQRPAAPTLTAPIVPTSAVPTSAPAALQPITLTVVARNLSFSPSALTIPAHVSVTLVMRNEDPGVMHDIGVNVVGGGRTETCPGPCTDSFVFAAPEPGAYQFFCSLHPEMVGELRVTP